MPAIKEDGKCLNLYLSHFESENMLHEFNSKVLKVQLSYSHFPQSIYFKRISFMVLKEANLNMLICTERIQMARIAFEIVYAHKK